MGRILNICAAFATVAGAEPATLVRERNATRVMKERVAEETDVVARLASVILEEDDLETKEEKGVAAPRGKRSGERTDDDAKFLYKPAKAFVRAARMQIPN